LDEVTKSASEAGQAHLGRPFNLESQRLVFAR